MEQGFLGSINNLEGKVNSLMQQYNSTTDEKQQTMLQFQIQKAQQKLTEMVSFFSNLMRQQHEGLMRIIGNIRGG